MKNTAFIGVVFFIMALLAKDVTAIGWQIWYHANKSYVAQNLCENRARPELKCNGKCHLAKQLSKTEGQSGKEKPLLPASKLKSTEGIISSFSIPVSVPGICIPEKHYFEFRKNVCIRPAETEEHPPSVFNA